MTHRACGVQGLAAFLAQRTGGAVVRPADTSSTCDVVIGPFDGVCHHRGLASYALVPSSMASVPTREVRERGWSVWFRGQVPEDGGRSHVTILSRHGSPGALAAVPTGRCLAIIAAYNEADVLESVVRHMQAEGVDVYIIDNWSTDGTYELTQQLVSEGLAAGTERFPDEEPAHSEWSSLLHRKAEVAVEFRADWALHSDADEIRTSPWPDLTLRDGLAVAGAMGANAIDFTVIDHPPVSDGFVSGDDVARALPAFHFGVRPGHFKQVKAWRPNGRVARMGGGHDIMIPGRRLFPFNFLVHHYPVRSQMHGRQKVLRDRRGRWSPDERARGWHRHYDQVSEATNFLAAPDGLLDLDPAELISTRLGEVVARLGLESATGSMERTEEGPS